jgi:hypothetical protein
MEVKMKTSADEMKMQLVDLTSDHRVVLKKLEIEFQELKAYNELLS